MHTRDLAGSEDLEHERQAVGDQLLRVLVLLDAAEVFEQALDQRAAVLDEAGPQGLQPGVQGPGNAWEHQHTVNTHSCPAGDSEGPQKRPCLITPAPRAGLNHPVRNQEISIS